MSCRQEVTKCCMRSWINRLQCSKAQQFLRNALCSVQCAAGLPKVNRRAPPLTTGQKKIYENGLRDRAVSAGRYYVC